MPGITDFIKLLMLGPRMSGPGIQGPQTPPPYTPGWNPNIPDPTGMQGPQPGPTLGQPPVQPTQQGQRQGGLLGNPQAMGGIAQLLMATLGGKNGGYMAQGAANAQQQAAENAMRQQQLQQQGEYQKGQIGESKLDRESREKDREEQKALREATLTAQQRQREITDYNTAQDNLRQAIISSGVTDSMSKQALADAVGEGLPELYRAKLKKFAETFSPAAEKAPGSAGEFMALKKNKLIPEEMTYTQWQAEQRTPTFEEVTYQDWSKKPANAGKTRDDYLIWKAKNSPSIMMQSGPPAVLNAGTREEMMARVPENLRARVQAILDYRVAPPSGYVLSRDPGWKQAKDFALQIDPTYDEKEFPTRAKIMAEYSRQTGSAAGAQINAINTVLGHSAVLGEAVDALENGDVQLLNRIANSLKVQTGATPVTTLKAIVNRVGPEVTRAYVGTGGEASERKENEGDFNPNYSPQQIKSNVAITIRLLRSKIDSIKKNWVLGMNKTDQEFIDRFMTPEALQAIEKWGPQSNKGGETDLSKYIIK
jgi:hypothetical protein